MVEGPLYDLVAPPVEVPEGAALPERLLLDRDGRIHGSHPGAGTITAIFPTLTPHALSALWAAADAAPAC
ncbi:MAG: hypothetical protein H0T88_05085, partial [Lysobacter sp.]|nr:hypothetical protein [Lysobacter sp.]